jgi:hypothetical protein
MLFDLTLFVFRLLNLVASERVTTLLELAFGSVIATQTLKRLSRDSSDDLGNPDSRVERRIRPGN